MTEPVDTPLVILTGVASALTLLAAATHLLLPVELSSPLLLGCGITLYLLVSGLPYTKNRLFALFLILTCTSAAAITIAAGAARSNHPCRHTNGNSHFMNLGARTPTPLW